MYSKCGAKAAATLAYDLAHRHFFISNPVRADQRPASQRIRNIKTKTRTKILGLRCLFLPVKNYFAEMSSEGTIFLKWDNFAENMHSTFSELRYGHDLFDVTLLCVDGTQMKAHKLVLSLGSTFFKDLFKVNKKEGTIIYMRGLKNSELASILDFLYHGQVKIRQEELNTFMALAKELCVKGLSDGEPENEDIDAEDLPLEYYEKTQIGQKNVQHLIPLVEKEPKTELEEPYKITNPISELNSFMLLAKDLQMKSLEDGKSKTKELDSENKSQKYYKKSQNETQKDLILIPLVDDETNEELEERYETMDSIFKNTPIKNKRQVSVALSDDLKQKMTELIKWNGDHWSCTVCGKKANPTHDGKRNLKRHTQTHMEGVSFTCNLCEKEFR